MTGSRRRRSLPSCLASFIPLLWLATATEAGPTPRDTGWEEMPLEHARIRFRTKDRNVAERVRLDVEEGIRRVSGNLGLESVTPLTVVLASDDADFRGLTVGAVPDWGAGCALPAHRTIILRKPHGAPRDLRETTFHEVSHILLRGEAGGRSVPVWFDEGAAMWNASEWRWAESWEMASAAAWGSLLPLDDIEDVLAFASPKARLAYAQSFFAVSQLVDLSGRDALARIAGGLRAGLPFEEAFTRVSGTAPAAFEALCRNAAHSRFGLTSLLWRASDLWFAVTGLFLLAYIATRIRNRRKVRQWEAEESPGAASLSVDRSPTEGVFPPEGPEAPVPRLDPQTASETLPSSLPGGTMVIGVTGGLGSGKTTVCRVFETLGARVIDADGIGRSVVERPEVRQALVAEFGEDIVDGEGRLDRRLVGRRAFASADARRRLNSVVWPPLLERLWKGVRASLSEDPARPVVVDAALLFEWGDLSGFDAVVVVTALEEVRVARMMSRMGIPEAEVKSRLEAQLPESDKVRGADYVIRNDGSREDLENRAEEVWDRLTRARGGQSR